MQCETCGVTLSRNHDRYCSRRCQGEALSQARNSTRYAIRRALQAKLTTTEVARQFNVSKTYVEKVKGQIVFEPPHLMLQRYRMEQEEADKAREAAAAQVDTFGPGETFMGHFRTITVSRGRGPWREREGCWTAPVHEVRLVTWRWE